MSLVTHIGVFVGGLTLGVTGASIFNGKRQHSNVDVIPIAQTPAQYEDKRLVGGYPGPVVDFLRHAAYVSAYDRAKRHPHWTAEHLTASQLQRIPGPAGSDRSRSVFKEDERVPLLFRVRNQDYFRSGYDRGHMVPAADAKASQEAMDETFYLSNIAPQVGEGFNRDYWAHTEDFVRRLTQKFANVYVFTVPLYLPRQDSSDGKWKVSYEVIGNPPSVSVPTHFAKVIYGSQQIGSSGIASTALGAFVMPNAVIPNHTPLQSFIVPIEAVERAAGLLLFPPNIKSNTRALCDTIDCSIVVRDFSNRKQNSAMQPLAAK